MLQITLDTSNLSRVTDQLHLLTERQLQFAVSRALNSTIKATTDTLRADLSRTSGGPIQGGATRWTLGGIYQRRANTARLEAETGIRQDTPRAAGRYLLPMIRGGMPRRKAVDSKLSAMAIRATNLVVQPTRNTRLTSQGNISRQRFTSVISRIGSPGGRVFIAPLRKGHADSAVWERFGSKRKEIRPLFLLRTPESRRSTFNLTADLRQSVDRAFPGEIRAALLAELTRAGFR